jgi:proteasome lid subunit RPN8/RPN11
MGAQMDIIVKMKKSDYEKILNYCIEGLPNESCGLLGGTVEGNVKTVSKVYLLTNTDASNEHFSMDPKEQFAALKDARSNGLSIIGNFHSHPESPSRPSEEDKRLAYDSTIEYLILSLMDMENPVLKAFGVDKDKNVTIHAIEYTD